MRALAVFISEIFRDLTVTTKAWKNGLNEAYEADSEGISLPAVLVGFDGTGLLMRVCSSVCGVHLSAI